jgi:hypothetical protein
MLIEGNDANSSVQDNDAIFRDDTNSFHPNIFNPIY